MDLPEVLTERIEKELAAMSFSSTSVKDFVLHELSVYIDREFKDAYISHLKRTSQEPHVRFKNSQDMMVNLSNEGNEMVSHLIIKALSKCEASAEGFLKEKTPASIQNADVLLDKLLKLVALIATPSGVALFAITVAVVLVLLGQASIGEIVQIFQSRQQ